MIWSAPRLLDRLMAASLIEHGTDFTLPRGEPGLVGPDSVSWRVFRNPVTMYIGGVAAVLLELGEPRVRHGVWDHSSFRCDPARRLRRTGQAAMVTVYGARSSFELLAARVARMHERVTGTTPAGEAYTASDPALLRWVQATASWAFAEAYRTWARPLTPAAVDRYYAEGAPGAAMYGVLGAPGNAAEMAALFAEMTPRLGPSPILQDLLSTLRTAAILPLPLHPLQNTLAAAAVALLPPDLRDRLGLARERLPSPPDRWLLRAMAKAAERTHWPSAPYAQASRRLGLPGDHILKPT